MLKHAIDPTTTTRFGAEMSQDKPAKVYNVLFVCTHNSARSIMADGLLNSPGRGQLKAWSAGSQPGGVVHPFALKTLAS
jgi:hypothetical protein